MTCIRVAALLLLIGSLPTNIPAQMVVTPQAACKALRGMAIPAGAIGLATTGATVRSTKLVHDGRGEYCKVLGGIHPVDPAAQDIRFEVNLPTTWNHKAVHFGGGSFDGLACRSRRAGA